MNTSTSNQFMRRFRLNWMLLLIINLGFLGKMNAQTLYDSFSDGNFTASPVWGGSTGEYTIVANSDAAAGATGSQTVRLNAPATGATRFLSSQISTWGDIQTWRFFIGRRAQALTGSNQAYFWLYANEATLNNATVDGYRIAIGDDAGGDDLRLEYIVNGTVNTTVIATSATPIPNGLTDIGLLVRVTRTAAGVWTIFTSTVPTVNGTGAIATDIPSDANTSVNQGSATNNTLVPAANGYIGFANLHTTGASAIVSTEWDQIYFDQSSAGGPTLTWAPTSFSSFTATAPAAGTPYSSASIAGSSLSPASGNITITAPTNFEVFNGTSWVTSYTIAYTGGALSATTVQMRIAAGAPAGPVSGTFTATGGTAPTANFAGSGTVIGPVLTPVVHSSFTGNKFHANNGQASDARFFRLSGASLTGSTTITPPTGYEVSITSATTGFAATQTITTTPTITNQQVWVRISAASSPAVYNGNITITSPGAATQTITIKGQKYPAASSFTPGNLMILRIGDGDQALSNAAQPIFLDEYTPAGVLVQSVAMPMSNFGSNRRFAISGTSTSDGVMNLSPDGKFLTLSGYNCDSLYQPNITSSSVPAVQRLVAIVDFNGTILTNTRMNAYNGNNIRGAVTIDGTGFWTTGPNATPGNICYVPAGNDGTGVVQLNTSWNSRSIKAFNSDLYISRQAEIGVISGTPTSGLFTPTAIISSLSDAFNFVVLDVDATVPGADLIYIADQVNGLLKYSKNISNVWTARGSRSGPTSSLVANVIAPGNIEIYLTNPNPNSNVPNSVYKVVDNTAFDANITGGAFNIPGNLVQTASANRIFRSVTFVPIDVPTPDVTFAFATPSGSFTQGEFNRGIYRVELTTDVANAVLTGASFTVGGSFAASDIVNYRLYFSTDGVLDGGDTPLGTPITTITGPGQVLNFTGLGQNFPVGTTRYLFVTASISGCATVGNTINITSTPLTNFTFADANLFGTPTAGTNRTIGAGAPANVTGLAATSGIPTVPISWTNPSCYDAILVVARAGSSVTANPVSLTYAFNNSFNFAPSFPGGGNVVYYSANPAATGFTMLGLTAGTTYHIKVFTRIGSTWSSGVEVTATPLALTLYTTANGIGYTSASPFSDPIWSTTPTGPGQTINAIFGHDLNNATLQNYAIIIRHNVQWLHSAARCRAIQVEAGAKIFRNSTTLTDNVYIRVYGTDIVINGEWGNGAGVQDQLSLEIEGLVTTLSGTAPVSQINIARIRKSQNVNPISTLTVARSINLTFAGAAFYNNVSGTSLNLTINNGHTVNVVNALGDVSIDGVDGQGGGNRGGVITVNGTLNIANRLFLNTLDNNATLPQPIGLTTGPNGRINTRHLIFDNVSATIGCNLNLHPNSRINVSGVAVIKRGVFTSNGVLTILDGGTLLHANGTPIPAAYQFGTGGFCDAASDVTGNINVRRVGSSNLAFYNYWSAPVSGAPFSSIRGLFNPATNNLYQYDPGAVTSSSNLLAGWVPPNTAVPMSVGRGYINTNVAAASFTGAANKGGLSTGVVVGSFTNFNLVGNPYPSGLSADDFIAANTPAAIQNSIFFWTNPASTPYSTTGGDYVAYTVLGTAGGGNNPAAVAAFNATKVIPSCQSFFVRANASTNVNFNNAMRRDGSGTVFFNVSDAQRIWIGATNASGANNEILFGFLNGATDDYDALYEAEKLDGNNQLSLYSVIGETRYAIQALPRLAEKRIIPLGFNANQIGELHTIALNKVDQLDETAILILEDRLLNVFHNLKESAYTFTLNEVANGTGRFYLHVSAPLELSATEGNCDDQFGKINVTVPSNDEWNITLKNAEGLVLTTATTSTTHTFNSVSAGNYTLALSNPVAGIFTKSISINTNEFVSVSLSANKTLVNSNEEVMLEATSNNALSYVWNFGNGETAETTAPIVFYAYANDGEYTVTVKAISRECESTASLNVKVGEEQTLNVAKVDARQLVILPNPARELAQVILPGVVANAKVSLIDSKGSVVMSEQLQNSASVTFTLTNLANGIYTVQVVSDKLNITEKLVVVQ